MAQEPFPSLMNKYELAKKINELEGLTNEEKSELLKLLRSQKKYGLVWEDKPENAELKMVDEMPVLEEVPERAIISDDAEAPNHVLIEGDNLEALTALCYTHTEKVDVIYIDPPYNTGNKDFRYNDDYVDKENEYRHSKWLSFMKRRLVIAKQLLSSKGVLLISIDENEIVNLRLLCCEIFLEKNFIACMPRITKASGKTTDKIANNHDYLLVFAKNKELAEINGLPHDDAGFKYQDEYKEIRGSYKLNQTLDYDSLQYSASLDYPIEIEGHTLYPGSSYDNYIERKKGNHKRADWAWRWSKDLYEFGLEKGFVVLKKSKNGYRIYTKTYQNAKIVKDGNSYKIEYSNRVKPIESLALTENVYSNDNAKKELGQLFDVLPFDYPKPTSLIKTFLKAIPAKTILDFFAGSGTTLHATMQLNAEDGGHRRCILATNNENGICENVTYERNRRVIRGYTTPKGEEVPGLTHNNLRYYKTKFVPRDKTTKNLRDLMTLSTDMLCIRNDAYTEKSFAGKNINKNIARYFESSDGHKRMLVIYREEAITAIVQLIKQVIEQEKNIHTEGNDVKKKLLVYVFSPNGYAYDDEFEDVADYVELCALPDALLNAYRRVLPKRKPQLLPDAELMETENGEAVGMGALESREQDLFDFNNNQEIGMAASEIQNKEGDDA